MTDELTSNSLSLAGKSREEKKTSCVIKLPLLCFFPIYWQPDNALVWIAILIMPCCNMEMQWMGATERRSSYLCLVTNVCFISCGGGRGFQYRLKIPNKKWQTDNRDEHEGRRRKREWRRGNGCPPKVKYWMERGGRTWERERDGSSDERAH